MLLSLIYIFIHSHVFIVCRIILYIWHIKNIRKGMFDQTSSKNVLCRNIDVTIALTLLFQTVHLGMGYTRSIRSWWHWGETGSQAGHKFQQPVYCEGSCRLLSYTGSDTPGMCYISVCVIEELHSKIWSISYFKYWYTLTSISHCGSSVKLQSCTCSIRLF